MVGEASETDRLSLTVQLSERTVHVHVCVPSYVKPHSHMD